jgi:integrase
MALTNVEAGKAQPKDKLYRLGAGDALFLLIKPNGSKLWQMCYRFAGKQKTYSIGVYGPPPKGVSLAEARERCGEAHKSLRNGIDPSANKQEKKRQVAELGRNTFKVVAEEWHQKNLTKWDPDHGAKILRRLEKHVFPYIGQRPVRELKPADMLAVLGRIEERNTTEILRRVNQTCAAVFTYAIITDRAEINPSAHLRGALKAHRAKNYPTIQAKDLPGFLTALEDVETTVINRLAVKLLLHTFVRTGEMRQAKWKDIDWEEMIWKLPAATTKMRVEHWVPLSPQVLSILTELKEHTGHNPHGLILPSQNRQKHPMMCENTINNVIKKMGYGGKQVGHGFRALASTTLNEQGYNRDAIERQLAHKEPNKVRAAYNRAEYWDERVKIIGHWSQFLEAQAMGAQVIQMKQEKAA